MRVYAFSAGWMSSIERLLRPGGSLRRARLSMTCLLVDRGDTLALVDVGFGRGTRANPWRNPGPLMQLMSPVEVGVGEPACERVRAIGRHPEEVTDIVCTHLDVDHVAGLEDFPRARVHVHADELSAALTEWTPRYQRATWAHGPLFRAFELERAPLLGFETSRDLFGDGSLFLLGAPGHSRGHVAVAIPRDGGWIVHTGDAVYLESEARAALDGLGPALRLLRRITDDDRRLVLRTQKLVADLMDRADVTLVTSHDDRGLSRLPPFPYPIA